MLPWIESDLDRLLGIWHAQHPHAVLLLGREGIGLDELAFELSRALLCEQPVGAHGRACGKCVACAWLALGNHPDFRLLQPEVLDIPQEGSGPSKEKKSEQIKIDQVRELQDFLSIGSHRGGRRVIVVRPAHAMNAATQNSLLKSLEEPGEGTLFLLVSGEPHRLLPTVLSRCQKIAVAKPEARVALAWLRANGAPNPEAQLALAAGAPIAAEKFGDELAAIRSLIKELADPAFDPIAVASAFQSTPPAAFIELLYRWSYDILAQKSVGRIRYFSSDINALSVLAGRSTAIEVCRYLRRLVAARALAQHPLNAKLVYEELLLGYRALVT